MQFIVVLVLLAEVFAGLRYPLVAAAIASQAYIIRYALLSSSPASVIASTQPIWGVLFPFLAYGFLALGALRRPNPRVPMLHPLDILLVLLGAILLFGVLYAPDTWRGLGIFARYIFLAYAYYFLSRFYLTNVSNPFNHVQLFYQVLWGMSVIAAILALFFRSLNDVRLTLPAVHPIPFGMLLASGLLINAFLLIYGDSFRVRLPRLVLVLTGLLLAYAFIASNNRGPFVSLLLSLFFLLMAPIMKRRFESRVFKRVISFAVLSGFLLAIVAFLQPDSVVRLIQGITNALFGPEWAKGQSALDRLDAWHTALALFVAKPMLGVGTGGFAHYHYLEYPHNLILEVASENGIVGLFVLLGILFLSIGEVLRAAYRRGHVLGLLAASLVVLNLTEAFVSFTLWMHKGLLLFLALLVSLNRLKIT